MVVLLVQLVLPVLLLSALPAPASASAAARAASEALEPLRRYDMRRGPSRKVWAPPPLCCRGEAKQHESSALLAPMSRLATHL